LVHEEAWPSVAKMELTQTKPLPDVAARRGVLSSLWAEHSDVALSVATAFVMQGLLAVSGVAAARILGAEGRGHLAALVLVAAVVAQAGTLGLPMSATYHIAREPGAALTLVRCLLRILVPLSVLLLAVQAAVLLALFGGAGGELQGAAAVTLGGLAGVVSHQFGLAVLQGCGRFRAFNLARTMQLTLYAGAVVALLLADSGSLLLVAAAWAASMLLSGVAVLAIALRGARGATELPRAGAGDLLRFGVTGLAGHTSPLEAYRIDQIAVGIIAGPVGLGLYIVGQAFANLPRSVARSIGMVAYPRIAAAEDGHRRQVLLFVGLALGACGSIVAALWLLVGELVPLFFGEEFAGAVPLARVLLLAALLFSLRRVLSDCARGLGLPGQASLAEAASWAVAIPAIAVLGHLWGAEGVAWALVLGGAGAVAMLAPLSLRGLPRGHTRALNLPTIGAVDGDASLN
jgi:O-antigen/teichoic acid export membrane protein